MIAAGVGTKAPSSYMGYSSMILTLDPYGHLVPVNETLAVKLLETWLTQALFQTACASSILAGASQTDSSPRS